MASFNKTVGADRDQSAAFVGAAVLVKRVIGVRDIFRQKAARASPSVKQLTHPSSEIH